MEKYNDLINMQKTTTDAAVEMTIESFNVVDKEVSEINVGSAFPAQGEDNETLNHALLTNRELHDQHPISAITELENILKKLSSVKDLYTKSGGVAEFRQWLPDDPNDEITPIRGIGYFVSLVNDFENNLYIDICTKDNDVYGVTVANSGFCGYQASTYDVLDSTSTNLANDPRFAKVCLIGSVQVRISEGDYFKVNIGDYVVPNEIGFASKSKDKVGFKVVSKGQITGNYEDVWHYVGIALVPQNDNINRIIQKMGNIVIDIDNANIQLDDIKDDIQNLENNNAHLSEKIEGIEGILGDSINNSALQLKDIQQIAQDAKDKAETTDKAMAQLELQYTDAKSQAQKAEEDATGALKNIANLSEKIEPLAKWEGETGSGIVGFLARAEKDHMELTTLLEGSGDEGSDLASIIQKIDENGAAIQHLVVHVDKYSIGNHSLSYGLPYDELLFLNPGHIYVPTGDFGHTEVSPLYICMLDSNISNETQYFFTIGDEKYAIVSQSLNSNTKLKYDTRTNELTDNNTYIEIKNISDSEGMTELNFSPEYSFTFELYAIYIWSQDDGWIKEENIRTSTNSEYVDGTNEGDLWYCWQPIIENDKILYYSNTLYRWDGKKWIAVATVNDSENRIMSFINQTSNSLTSSITNVKGDMSVIRQGVDEISTVVERVDGQLSSINQTAKDIMLGVFDPNEGSTSLELFLGGMRSVSSSTGHIMVERVLDSGHPVSYDGMYYEEPPKWDGEKFVFPKTDVISLDARYYFHTDSQLIYCKRLGNLMDFFEPAAGYEIYTIGNTAIASLDNRVSDTESEMSSWTKFQAGVNETVTSITQKSDEEGAEISSVVFGEYRKCVDIKQVLTEEELNAIPTKRYSAPPNWTEATVIKETEDGTELVKVKQFKFDDEDVATQAGIYYTLDEDLSRYYKVLKYDDTIIDFGGNDVVEYGAVFGYEEYEMRASSYASIMQKIGEDGSAIGLVAGNEAVEGGIFVKAINDQSSVFIDANKIGINGTAIFTDNLGNGTTTISGNYIRTGVIESENYEDGEKGFSVNGTRINLKNGSIKSQNFSIRDGDVSISGKITATSGYIGNKNNGFTIQKQSKYTFNVSNFGLEAGHYYFLVDEEYFAFELSHNLSKGDKITLYPDIIDDGEYRLEVMAGGEKYVYSAISFSEDEIDSELYYEMSYDDESVYCLFNGQEELSPLEEVGKQGIYISPNGIGLGNGNFCVDYNGNITMKGDIYVGSAIYTDEFMLKPDSDGKRASLRLWGDFGGSTLEYLKISTFEGDSPIAVISSPCSSGLNMNFSNITFNVNSFSFYRQTSAHYLFSVQDNTNTVSLCLYNHCIGQGNSDTFYPEGKWNFKNATTSFNKSTIDFTYANIDFTGANTQGLYAVAVFG